MRRAVVLVLGTALGAAGCGGEPENRAAEPATAPELSTAPAGVVVPVGSTPEGIVVGAGGTALVGTREPDGLTLLEVATDGSGAEVLEVLATPSGGRHIDLAGPDGPALVPLEGNAQVLRVDLTDGAVLTTTDDVGAGPHNAVRTSDGTVVVTNEQGGGLVLLRDGAVVESVPAGPPQPGGLAAVGRYAVVADVQGDGVYVYDASTSEEVAHRVIGEELTHALALAPAGTTDGTVVAFADTTGGAVLLTEITPDIVDLARIDVPGGDPTAWPSTPSASCCTSP